nr:unnamed protein product [Digitaria exilis]
MRLRGDANMRPKKMPHPTSLRSAPPERQIPADSQPPASSPPNPAGKRKPPPFVDRRSLDFRRHAAPASLRRARQGAPPG